MRKKLITLFILLFTCGLTKAQVTITASSFPNIGDVFINHNDSMASWIIVDAPAANQTWNYATLNNHYNDTITVVSVASTPNGAAFPTADLAAKQGDGYIYMDKTATECDFIGASGSQMGSAVLNIHYTTPMIVAKDGITYNSNYNFVNSFLLELSGTDVGFSLADSVRIHSDTYVSKIADSWGSVISPIGAFPCLRIMERDSAIQVIDVKFFGSWTLAYISQTNVNVSYSFMDNLNIDAIVQLNMDSTSSTVGSAAYRQSWPLGINDKLNPSLFTLFPNPSSNNNIHLLIGGLPADKYVVQLFDMTGRQINSAIYSINQTAVTDINYSALQLCDGNYIAVVSTSENKILQSLKFEVVK